MKVEILENRNDEMMEPKPVSGLRPRALAAFNFGALLLREYQQTIFRDQTTGLLILHWSRQIGKSYTLAAWAVYRLVTRPGRLVTVLSNSKENGAEFLLKCSEICRLTQTQFTLVKSKSTEPDFEDYRMELRIRIGNRTGRIKVLAANPRTARGFSGDLILDEFAFHENGSAIWDAVEPILAAHPDYLCRIASTGNGHHNLFYQMVSGAVNISAPANPNPERSLQAAETTKNPTPAADFPLPSTGRGTEGEGWEGSDQLPVTPPAPAFLQTTAGFKLSRISRTQAHSLGVPIFDPRTRQPITPEQARTQALDKRAYDQNYECSFADENLALLTHELITAAEDDTAGEICDQDFNDSTIQRLRACVGYLYVGFDIGRKQDLSVITVLETVNNLHHVRAILRMRDMRFPDQETRLGQICHLPRFQRASLDMTGLGLGLFEYAQKSFGSSRIRGINFASTVPATKAIQLEGRKRETVRVTEAMATELLRTYEDRRIRHPRDSLLRDDLRKPEKVTSPSGQVSIAATRDEAGHADHFWSLALALESATAPGSGKFEWQSFPRRHTNALYPRTARRRIL